jgi:hypothetical protein
VGVAAHLITEPVKLVGRLNLLFLPEGRKARVTLPVVTRASGATLGSRR